MIYLIVAAAISVFWAGMMWEDKKYEKIGYRVGITFLTMLTAWLLVPLFNAISAVKWAVKFCQFRAWMWFIYYKELTPEMHDAVQIYVNYHSRNSKNSLTAKHGIWLGKKLLKKPVKMKGGRSESNRRANFQQM